MVFKEYGFPWSSPVDLIIFNNVAKFNDHGPSHTCGNVLSYPLKLNNTFM